MSEMIARLPDAMELVYLPLLLLAVLAHFIAEPLRWYWYTGKSFETTCSQLFNIFSLTALANYILPLKMGLPTRILLIRLKTRIGVVQCSALLMLDGVISYACWGLMSLIALSLLAGQASLEMNLLSAITILLFLAILSCFSWKKRHLLFSQKINAGINKAIDSDNYGIKELVRGLSKRTLFIAGLIMLLDIGAHVIRHWAMFSMLSIDLAWSTIFIITTISLFTGILSMMPMGLGGYDAMLVLLLTQFSVPPEHAISIAILNRLAGLLVSLLTGIYGGIQLQINPFRKGWRSQISDSGINS